MTRFAAASGLAAVLLAGAFFLPAPTRYWVWGGTLACYLTLVGLGVAFIRMRFFCRAQCRGVQGGSRVALTFDDGPDPAATPVLLDVLRELNAPAAFFCIGERVRANPDLVRRIAADRHEIGNHTFCHAWWTSLLCGRRLDAEISRCQDILREVLGREATRFRPPMGLTNPHFGAALRRAGLTMVGWDVRSLDHEARDAQRVIRRVLRRCRDGSIILLHDGDADPDVLRAVVSGVVTSLRAREFAFVSLDDLLNEAN